ncbi:LysR substrate-binding domain-containing protein [Vibrio ostreicida]|uniref:LysR substrate-binding domain-containing protein n=1 Tax=Vibrio ostreicida TaxID=526588 RepID=A0ABT8BXX8_9VIBR|nr:LysR substrate-binding domain-containing protein [Vibrio ostreicida]MDN3611544.1 LysR substrate-binding domain-containing protein [Vibrio ostreicida]
MSAATQGHGIIRLPCDLANPLIHSGALVPILNQYHYSNYALWALYLSRSYQQPLVRCFIDFLLEHWKKDIKQVTRQ